MPVSDRGTVGWLALGLLLDGPAGGHELWRRAERTVAHFWPVTRSALYAELSRLEERGYVTSTEVAQHGLPDKRVHRATPAGRQAFEAWLTEVDLAERPRHPQQLLLFFAAHLSRAERATLLDGWRDKARAAERNCRQILADRDIDPDDRPAGPRPTGGPTDPRLLTALFGLRRAQADLAFLDEITATVLDHQP
jgi:DNA-binding PadR family transcriptional regulator